MHITTGSPPLLRIDGDDRAAQAAAARRRWTPSSSATRSSPRSRSIQFEKTNELDLSFGVKGLSRFRANIYMQRGAVAGAFRTIPFKILTFEELGLPPVVDGASRRSRSGLVLVTGPTGSGKIDDARGDHRQDQQRAAPPHHHDRRPDRVPAPAQAVDRQPARGGRRHRGLQARPQVRPAPGPRRGARRRDARPRDDRGRADHRETGHLVFATLHTNSAVSDHQPHHRRVPAPPAAADPRASCRSCSRAIISQQLLPRAQRAGPRAWPSRSWSRTPRSGT